MVRLHSSLSNLISLLSATQVCSPSHVGLLSVLYQGFLVFQSLPVACFLHLKCRCRPQINLVNLQATALQPHGLGLPSSHLGGVCVFPSPYTHLPTPVTHSFASPLYVMFLSHQLCKPHKGRAMSATVPLYDWLTQCLEHQRHSINSVDWIKRSCSVILLVFSTLLSNESRPPFMLNTHNAQTKSLTWRRRNRTLAWC